MAIASRHNNVDDGGGGGSSSSRRMITGSLRAAGAFRSLRDGKSE